MKRLLDITAALTGLVLLSPIFLIAMLLIWRQDFHSPFFIAPRVGIYEKIFNMVKLRSMIVGAEMSGVDSTSAADLRITPIGQFVRRFKLDEITQLWNVLTGAMSLVGPRPNVKRETDLYTPIEKNLLSVRPGITDMASIVFSDENEILQDSTNPDIDYNQLIRPWKSRLGLLYIENRSFWLDIKLIFLTLIAIFSRRKALYGVNKLLTYMNASDDVIRVSRREDKLVSFPPPGSDTIVTHR